MKSTQTKPRPRRRSERRLSSRLQIDFGHFPTEQQRALRARMQTAWGSCAVGMRNTCVESYRQKVVLGLVILGAVLLDKIRNTR